MSTWVRSSSEAVPADSSRGDAAQSPPFLAGRSRAERHQQSLALVSPANSNHNSANNINNTATDTSSANSTFTSSIAHSSTSTSTSTFTSRLPPPSSVSSGNVGSTKKKTLKERLTNSGKYVKNPVPSNDGTNDGDLDVFDQKKGEKKTNRGRLMHASAFFSILSGVETEAGEEEEETEHAVSEVNVDGEGKEEKQEAIRIEQGAHVRVKFGKPWRGANAFAPVTSVTIAADASSDSEAPEISTPRQKTLQHTVSQPSMRAVYSPLPTNDAIEKAIEQAKTNQSTSQQPQLQQHKVEAVELKARASSDTPLPADDVSEGAAAIAPYPSPGVAGSGSDSSGSQHAAGIPDVTRTLPSGLALGGSLVYGAASKAHLRTGSSKAHPPTGDDLVDELHVLRAEKISLEEQYLKLRNSTADAASVREDNRRLKLRVKELEAEVVAMKKERLALVSRLADSAGGAPAGMSTGATASEDSSASQSFDMVGVRAAVQQKYGSNVVAIKSHLSDRANIQPEPEDGVLYGEYSGRWDIKAGSVEKLVEKLYTPSETHSVASYVPVFLLTYRSFMSSEELLRTLVDRYTSTLDPPDSAEVAFSQEDGVSAEDQKVRRARIVNFIKQWVENYFFDFEHDNLLVEALISFIEHMRSTASRAQNAEAAAAKLADMLDNVVQRQWTGVSKSKEFTFSTETPAVVLGMRKQQWDALMQLHKLNDGPGADATAFRRQIEMSAEYMLSADAASTVLATVDACELARQFTLAEFELFRTIQPKELLNLAWMDDEKEQRAPNILLMIKWFNEMSGWVTSSIVSESGLKRRVILVKKWIKVAQEALRLNNFNLIFEITSGLTNSAVFRLSKTWDSIKSSASGLTNVGLGFSSSREHSIMNASPGKFFPEMERIVSSSKNFKYYKTLLRAANGPCIPYLGVFLSSLTFIEQGNKDFSPDPQGEKPSDFYVNFYKRQLIAAVINGLRQFQLQPYNLISVPELQRLVLRVGRLEEKEAYACSLKAEPREG